MVLCVVPYCAIVLRGCCVAPCGVVLWCAYLAMYFAWHIFVLVESAVLVALAAVASS